MNASVITFSTPGGEYAIPNRWQTLEEEHFLPTFSLLERWVGGKLSPIELQTLYVCTVLGVDHRKVFDAGGGENLYTIAGTIDFLLSYDSSEDRYQIRQPLFARQFLPRIRLCGEELVGYTVCTAGGMLSTDLQSIRFIDALDLLAAGTPDSLLSLTLTLYAGGVYSAESVHRRAGAMQARLTEDEARLVRAVAFQFGAFASYIFSLPRYELLKGRDRSSAEKSEYALGLEHTLYSLCSDGLGTASEVEGMPVLRFLETMRAKLIEGIRSMHEAGVKIFDIEEKTGVDVATISQIIH
ncbi:hypothetical protein CS544_02575 [Porphyromonas gingivalis]|uniref:Uncharacterized protein n=2 Tax=Nixviridae TaxID=3424665 RepID=A0AAT9J929_9CAUD|nr:hypothetical protein [Porphyromonas gingivalis]ATR90085.1 hypothetical protein CS544_02575 [Porphyromonas gingivalis]OWR80760.1 hypothetical protein SJDPG11_03230 [Porphyromonas gingivalis SJD11]